jgi:DNA-binding protein HU-beta
MNKTEFVAAVVSKTGLTKVDVEKVVSAYHEVVTETLAKKEEVGFVGFGTFKTSERSARKGRNPQTGAEINIAASTVPAFKAGKRLKDAVKD